MRFADIKGQDDIKRALTGMADSGRVAHAMLFFENEGCGALPLVLAFYQYLNCTNRQGADSCGECPSCRKISKMIHPDLHFVFPVNSGTKISASEKPSSQAYMKYWRELALANPYFTESELYSALGMDKKSGNIAVTESKAILEKLALASVEGGYQAVVIWLPEKMNAEAANRLLKVVEEPPQETVFLFITHSPEKVLQTIFSRCQSFRVSPLPKEDVAQVLNGTFSISPERAANAAAGSGGSVGTALASLGDREEERLFMDIFRRMTEASLAGSLTLALEAGEAAAALKSREKMKGFCTFAAGCIEKIFLLKNGMPALAGVMQEDEAFLSETARRCKGTFCPRALEFFSNATMLIERNVNEKIVFCDLMNRIFVSI